MLTSFRTCVFVVLLAAMALGVVAMRRAQASTAMRILSLETRWVSLRRELWQVQTRVARLKSPDRVYHRVGWFQQTLLPPDENNPGHGAMRVVLNP